MTSSLDGAQQKGTMNKKLIIFIAVLGVAMLAFSQDGGKGQGGGKQGQRERGGQRQGGGGGNGIAALIGRADVQAELKVTSDQKTKLTDLVPQRGQRGQGGQGDQGGQGGQSKGNKGSQGGQGGDQGDRSANRARQAELEKKVAEILDDKQEAKLAELVIQRAGNRAVFDEKVASKLDITNEQMEKIKALREKQREAQQALSEKTQTQEITREEARAARDKNEKTLDTEIGKILTDKQKAQLRSLGGAPFKFDE